MVQHDSAGATWEECGQPIQIPRIAVAIKHDVASAKKMAREVVTSGKAAAEVAPASVY